MPETTLERIRRRQAEITATFERLDDLDHEQNQLIKRLKFLLQENKADAKRLGEEGTPCDSTIASQASGSGSPT